MPHPDFDALFQENTVIAAPALSDGGVALRETQRCLDRALVRYQQDHVASTAVADRTLYWDRLRRHLDAAAFERVLQLASRHSLAWTNAFIESLVVYDANTRGFSVQPQRLKTLLFLQQHCGLQSRDLSSIQSPNSSPNALYSSSSVLYLFERGIEGDQFNTSLLDEVYRFLKTLEHSNAINWVMFLVKNGFLNFSMLHKTCFIEKNGQKQGIDEGAFLDWLAQWAQQCGVEQEMKADDAWSTRCQSNNSLTARQRTVRNLVRYGLSPPTYLGAPLATRKTVLSYYQTQDSTFYESDQFVPSIVGDSVTSSKDNHDWLQSYTNPEDRYTLYRLRQVLPLDRLKFYHDYRRLPALIQQVQTGTLSLVEVEEYDEPMLHKEHFHSYDIKSKEFEISYMTHSSRVLPRLLAGLDEPIDHLSLSERIKKRALYDMYDYMPQPNPVSDDDLDDDLIAYYQEYDIYLKEFFDQVILLIAEERARLYEKLVEVKKKNADQSSLGRSFLGNFDHVIHLIEQKIDIFSGFLEQVCYELKHNEISAAQAKSQKKKCSCVNMNVYSYCAQITSEKNPDGRPVMKQNSLYRLECGGSSSPADIKNPAITRSDCKNAVMNEPRHPVTSSLKYIVGKLFSFTKWLVQIPIWATGACNIQHHMKTSYLNMQIDTQYAGVFYSTQSYHSFFKISEKAFHLEQKFYRKSKAHHLSYS